MLPGMLGKFNPLKIPGCALWLEADRGVTLDGSNNVSAWADQSGNGRHVSNANDAQRPAYIASAVNGRPGLLFSNHLLTAVAFSLSSAFTMIAVFKSTESTDELIVEHGTNTNLVDGFFLNTSINSSLSIRRTNKTGSNAAMNWGNTNAFLVATVSSNGTQASNSLRLNGSALTLSDHGTPYDLGISDVSNTFHVGARYNDAGGSLVAPFIGSIVAIVLYNRAITISECQHIERLYGSKYGITIS
jgi:hypothetical protein